MGKSAIILAGGFSNRFGQDKGLLQLANKPLIKHVLDAISSLVDEKMVVASSKVQAENYAKVLGSDVNVLIDVDDAQSPLIGALTGFKEAHERYALLLSCDTPFVSRDVVSLLFELCINRNAVIPRWPNGYIEPLQAVYCAKPAYEAAQNALSEGKLNMQSMVDRLRSVRYVSTLVLQQLDPGLRTFFNVNTLLDLRRAESMLRRG
ncbi:MAG: molybdenum cofactor guanylyltransferase [Candidatus Bathyarchaeota archaeon]|nr:molybdenum cofactor guanylyltransferase [Candidatus Bathyarchaeota archaeon]